MGIVNGNDIFPLLFDNVDVDGFPFADVDVDVNVNVEDGDVGNVDDGDVIMVVVLFFIGYTCIEFFTQDFMIKDNLF